MPLSWLSRSNDAGGGSFYSRTNNGDIFVAFAGGFISGGASPFPQSSAPTATASGYASVTLVAPLYTGIGSLLYVSNFTGTPAAGDIVRYPTTNGFQVLSDGSTQSDTNSGAYACFYTALDASFTDFAFTVNLSGVANALGDLATAASVVVNGSAVGFTAGIASGALATVTTVSADASAAETAIASGAIGTVTAVTVDGVGNSSSFPGDASGSLAIATATVMGSIVSGAAVGLGALDTAVSVSVEAIGNEVGRGDAMGAIPSVTAITVDARGRAQWGRVQKASTIWTLVPKHG